MSLQQRLAFEPSIYDLSLEQLLAMPLRGLSLLQPWATLVALGLKKLETRSWLTQYRGGLAIHASKGKSREVRELCAADPFIRAALDAAGLTYDTLPRGEIVAYSQLSEVRQIQSKAPATRSPIVRPGELTPHERAFGDYRDGRYAWSLQDTVALTESLPVDGSLQLWKVPALVHQPLIEQAHKLLHAQ